MSMPGETFDLKGDSERPIKMMDSPVMQENQETGLHSVGCFAYSFCTLSLTEMQLI